MKFRRISSKGLLSRALGAVGRLFRRKPKPVPAPTAVPPQYEDSPAAGFVYGGEPYFVRSSNVAMAQYHHDTRQMMVEYLAKTSATGKHYPASAYLYDNVSELEAFSFFGAGSKGKWIWDKFRIRGTKYGHRKPYKRIR